MSRSKPKITVAVFGGSFDPPHLGHVLATQYLLASGTVDEIWWMPCWDHYFHKKLAPYVDRKRMCSLAIRSLPLRRVRVSGFEGELKHDGRSLILLRALKKKYGARRRFKLVIGSDLLKERRRWYRFDAIEREFGVVVVPRGGAYGIPAVSSSAVRSKLRGGKLPTPGWIAPAVLQYIDRHGLYTPKQMRYRGRNSTGRKLKNVKKQ